jgi:phosphoserine aminotransferase
MARVPLPERGQPLDVTYIYQLADTINDISTEISSATYNYTTVDTLTAGKQSIKTSDTRIIGGYVQIANNSNVNSGNEKTFSYDFPSDFKYAPIATATAVNVGNTPAGRNVSVILNNITTSRVEGVVRFASAGNVSLAVNIIVIGIPN